MKTRMTSTVLGLLLVTSLSAQTPNTEMGGGEYKFNQSQTPCLSADQRTTIKSTLQNSVANLKSHNNLAFSYSNREAHPLFIWPIRKAADASFFDVWSISGYVDHNENFPDQLTDFNCGNITYDTNGDYNHQGLDIYNWPYTWKLMDDDAVEIIAAADGQINAKGDGQFDRSCDFNNNQWNAIYVQHNDGSIAWYGHMKSGSLSNKSVGDMVTSGEYLGVVGSSGNSTGPHLHFEVYTDNCYSQLVDLYAGSYNNTNIESWWADQKPYTNTNINALMTHSEAPVVFPNCPTTETTNESNQFDLGDNVFFSVYLRDQLASTDLNLKIRRPDGNYLFNWMQTATTTSSSWYYYWNAFPDVEGEWQWEVTYQGQTETIAFNVGESLSAQDNELSDVAIFPNPTNDILHIKSKSIVTSAALVDITGKQIWRGTKSEGINSISLQDMANGMYFSNLDIEGSRVKTIKVLKQ